MKTNTIKKAMFGLALAFAVAMPAATFAAEPAQDVFIGEDDLYIGSVTLTKTGGLVDAATDYCQVTAAFSGDIMKISRVGNPYQYLTTVSPTANVNFNYNVPRTRIYNSVEDYDYIEAYSTLDSPICAAVCGDGLLDFDEQCDDGNNIDGDGCSADCQVAGGGGGGEGEGGTLIGSVGAAVLSGLGDLGDGIALVLVAALGLALAIYGAKLAWVVLKSFIKR